MDAISKTKGFLLISSLFILTILIVIVSFYLDGILQETRVARITGQAAPAYYLAEAAVAEVLWKLGHDNVWKNNFENDPTWTVTLNRSNVPLPGGSYAATVANLGIGNANITATSTVTAGDAASQRVIKLAIFKPLNTSPVNGIALFSNEDIDANGAELTVTGADVFTNDDMDIVYFSNWNIGGNVRAADIVTVSPNSTITASAIRDRDRLPAPSVIDMITIDFASGESTSYLARANQIYTESQFAQLLINNPVLTLTGITYVTGNIHVKAGQTLTVNGALVADGTITVGAESGAGTARLDVNKVGADPSGLLSRKNIKLGGYAANVTVDGLIYAGGEFRVEDGTAQDVDLAVVGGIFAQSVKLYNLWDPIFITHNQSYINEARPVSAHSQTVVVNHWEESY